MTKKNEPIKKFEDGWLTAALWENEGENGVFHNITLSRAYKDGDTTKHTDSIRAKDGPRASRLIDEASHYALELERTAREARREAAKAESAA